MAAGYGRCAGTREPSLCYSTVVSHLRIHRACRRLELCTDWSNRPIWTLLSKQKCCPALQVTASPLVTAVHRLSQAMPTLPAAGPRLQAEQCLLKSKPANQGQLRERAGKTPAFPPPIKTSLHTIHPPALQ